MRWGEIIYGSVTVAEEECKDRENSVWLTSWWGWSLPISRQGDGCLSWLTDEVTVCSLMRVCWWHVRHGMMNTAQRHVMVCREWGAHWGISVSECVPVCSHHQGPVSALSSPVPGPGWQHTQAGPAHLSWPGPPVSTGGRPCPVSCRYIEHTGGQEVSWGPSPTLVPGQLRTLTIWPDLIPVSWCHTHTSIPGLIG